MLLWRPAPVLAGVAEDNGKAVIFVYQRVGEDSVPQGNISLEQFREHITELAKDGYAVLPLEKIIDALKSGGDLPPKTVAITFEGAYQATLANALPLLREAGMPFTIFFAADMADGGVASHMSWEQLKKLRKDGLASFGILPASYAHMVNQTEAQNAALINRAVARYREVLREDPVFFAYPYGEVTAALKKQISGYSFKAAFGQQSGVIHAHADFLALPRFTMTDDYGDLDRFMLTANALPLPVSDLVPEDMLLAKNPPTIGFTVTPAIENLSKLSCFASNLGKLPLVRLPDNRVEIRPDQPFVDRRTRINCTLPDKAAGGDFQSWRWFGMLLVSPAIEEDAESDNISDKSAEDPESQ